MEPREEPLAPALDRTECWGTGSRSAGPLPSPCPQGARSEHFSAQALAPRTGPPTPPPSLLQGAPLAVRKGGPQLLSPAPVAGVKGPSAEVEKPPGFS